MPVTREPLCAGEPLSVWLEHLLQPGDTRRSGAPEALRQLGPEAAAALVPHLSDPAPERRLAALEALALLDEDVSPALPALIDLLGDIDWQVRGRASDLFQWLRLDAGAVPVLLAAWDRASERARSPLLNQLARLPLDVRFLPLLQEVLRKRLNETGIYTKADGDTYEALRALAQLGKDALPTLPLLLTALKARRESSCDIGGAAVEVLVGLGAAAVPSLLATLASSCEEQHERAVITLARIGQEAGLSSLTGLREALNGERPRQRAGAVEVLAQLKPATREALSELRLTLSDPEPLVRQAAVAALGLLAADSADLLPILLGILRDADAKVRAEARTLLLRYGAAVVPQLIEALQVPPSRCGAIEVLGALGPVAEPAVPALLRLALDPVPEQWQRLITALGQIGRPARAAAPLLLHLARHSDPRLREVALTALGQIGVAEAVPLLMECITRGTDKQLALLALGRIGRAARAATPVILPLVRSENKDERCLAMETLGRIATAEAALPVLLPVLRNRQLCSWELASAMEALERLGPDAQAAVPLLQYWAAEGDSLASMAASAALKRIQPPLHTER